LFVAGPRGWPWRKIRLVGVEADGDVTGLFRQSGSLPVPSVAHDGRPTVRACREDRTEYCRARQCCCSSRVQIHTEGLFRQTGVEAVGDGDGLDSVSVRPGRLLSAETDADVRRHLLDESGEIPPIDWRRRATGLGRSSAGLPGRSLPKPVSLVANHAEVRRRESIAAYPRAEVLHSRREVAVDFLKSHFLRVALRKPSACLAFHSGGEADQNQ